MACILFSMRFLYSFNEILIQEVGNSIPNVYLEVLEHPQQTSELDLFFIAVSLAKITIPTFTFSRF